MPRDYNRNFESRVHEDRGALAVVNGIVYVPYSGYFGDCGGYHGSVVGVHINNPSTWWLGRRRRQAVVFGDTQGVASDGTNMFVITGNTFKPGQPWRGGEAIIRLQAGPTFSGNPTDYWAPTNWLSAR